MFPSEKYLDRAKSRPQEHPYFMRKAAPFFMKKSPFAKLSEGAFLDYD